MPSKAVRSGIRVEGLERLGREGRSEGKNNGSAPGGTGDGTYDTHGSKTPGPMMYSCELHRRQERGENDTRKNAN